MNQPRRLVEDPGLGARLLESVMDDRIPAASLDRALEVAAAASVVASAAGGIGSMKLSSWLVVKWLGVGFAGGMVAALGPQAILGEPAARPSAAAMVAPAVLVGGAPGAGRAALPAASSASAELSSARPAPPSRSNVAPSMAPGPALTPAASGPSVAQFGPSDTLRQEIALVDGARGAMSRNDAAQALQLVDRYAAGFPRGRFGVETSLLKIEALIALGRHDDARAQLQTFAATHPAHPALRRLARALGDAP
jgi:hypothetical protein